MSSGVPLNPPRRSVSFASGALVNATGIKTSFATSASPVVLTVADFNGALISSTTGVITGLPRSLTITRSNSASQFSTADIIVTGRRGPSVVTATLTPPNANGNDTLRFAQAWDAITTISLPAQGGTGGTFTIGVQDICAPAGDTFVGVELAANGTLNVQYGEAANSPTDAIPVIVTVKSDYRIAPTRVLTSAALSSPTSVGLTVYLP